MVLADGGVVCIDEFDKMREQDRVAIHEAMEQQTISVAKAGITTILNSRTSVLAAANPVGGRYIEEKSAAENIDFLPTILSRFDLIFIVRDIRDEENDKKIAKHVMGVHVNASSNTVGRGRYGKKAGRPNNNNNNNKRGEEEGSEGRGGGGGGDEDNDIDISTLKRFIAYCREKCAPRLSTEAAEVLRNHYVTIRETQRRRHVPGSGAATVPITVRQLEAITRVSESLAKLNLLPEANAAHVNEAIRLFKVSTLAAANSTGSGENSMAEDGLGGGRGRGGGRSEEEERERMGRIMTVQRAEEHLKSRLMVGSTLPVLQVRCNWIESSPIFFFFFFF